MNQTIRPAEIEMLIPFTRTPLTLFRHHGPQAVAAIIVQAIAGIIVAWATR